MSRIAARQDNVVTLAQLEQAGMTRKMLAARLRAGVLQRLHRAVFLVGPAPPSFDARARAAALAVGGTCTVALGSAAVLLGLRRPPETAEGRELVPIDLIVAGRNPGMRAGVVIHRSTLVDGEWGQVRGIPVTSPERTICDLAAHEPIGQIEQMLIDARRARLVTDARFRAVLDRVRRRRGHAALRRLLADEREEGYSRSKAERMLRKLLRDAALAEPAYNEQVCGLLVDGHWRAVRVVIEVDGRKDHATPWAFEEDRRRDQILIAAGYRVIRVTWRQLVNDPIAVAARIAQALVWAQVQSAA